MSPTLEEVRTMFPRCPCCGYKTSLLMQLVLVRRGQSLRVAHDECFRGKNALELELAGSTP